MSREVPQLERPHPDLDHSHKVVEDEPDRVPQQQEQPTDPVQTVDSRLFPRVFTLPTSRAHPYSFPRTSETREEGTYHGVRRVGSTLSPPASTVRGPLRWVEAEHGEESKSLQESALPEYDSGLQGLPPSLQTESVQVEVDLDDKDFDSDVECLEDIPY